MTYRNTETDDFFRAVLSLENVDECYRFFEDVCTVKEILDIAQRLQVARMLYDKKSYTEIGEATGMSTATISRVNRCLTYGSGGYPMIIERLFAEKKQ